VHTVSSGRTASLTNAHASAHAHAHRLRLSCLLTLAANAAAHCGALTPPWQDTGFNLAAYHICHGHHITANIAAYD